MSYSCQSGGGRVYEAFASLLEAESQQPIGCAYGVVGDRPTGAELLAYDAGLVHGGAFVQGSGEASHDSPCGFRTHVCVSFGFGFQKLKLLVGWNRFVLCDSGGYQLR